MEGNRIEDYNLDALVRRFRTAETRAYNEDRVEDASDYLLAGHLVCILRGDFEENRPESREPSLRRVG